MNYSSRKDKNSKNLGENKFKTISFLYTRSYFWNFWDLFPSKKERVNKSNVILIFWLQSFRIMWEVYKTLNKSYITITYCRHRANSFITDKTAEQISYKFCHKLFLHIIHIKTLFSLRFFLIEKGIKFEIVLIYNVSQNIDFK